MHQEDFHGTEILSRDFKLVPSDAVNSKSFEYQKTHLMITIYIFNIRIQIITQKIYIAGITGVSKLLNFEETYLSFVKNAEAIGKISSATNGGVILKRIVDILKKNVRTK